MKLVSDACFLQIFSTLMIRVPSRKVRENCITGVIKVQPSIVSLLTVALHEGNEYTEIPYHIEERGSTQP